MRFDEMETCRMLVKLTSQGPPREAGEESRLSFLCVVFRH